MVGNPIDGGRRARARRLRLWRAATTAADAPWRDRVEPRAAVHHADGRAAERGGRGAGGRGGEAAGGYGDRPDLQLAVGTGSGDGGGGGGRSVTGACGAGGRAADGDRRRAV